MEFVYWNFFDIMDHIVDYLRDRYSPWVWIGQRAHDACGINRVLPLDMIVSCDRGKDLALFFPEGQVHSVEGPGGPRRNWSNEDMDASLSGELGRRVFAGFSKEGKRAALLCYRSVKALESRRRSKYAPRIFAAPLKLKGRFDNKVLLYKALDGLSLPRIDGLVAAPGKKTFGDLSSGLGLPFVVQFPFGSSGKYTFIVRDRKTYTAIRRKYPDKKAVIRKYLRGYSLNVNAVIVTRRGRTETLCAFPSIQLTGIAECSASESAYCGNDYTGACSLDRDIIRQVDETVKKTGRWMARSGYRGIFGMDFLVKDGKVYPVEINPRFQNSTSLFNSLQAAKGHGWYLFVLHIAEMLRDEDRRAAGYVASFPAEELMRPLKGCQVILHNMGARGVIRGDVTPGVYKRTGEGYVLRERGAFIGGIQHERDILVTSGVPAKGTVIYPGAPICKVQSISGVLKDDRRTLTDEAARAVRSVYGKLRLTRRS